MAVGSPLYADGAGRDLVAGDVALGAGFGTAPVLTIAAGSNRSRGRLTIEADATAAQATATVTITFPEPYDAVPVAVVCRDATSEGANPDVVTKGFNVKDVTETEVVFVANTIPVDADLIGLAYVIVG